MAKKVKYLIRYNITFDYKNKKSVTNSGQIEREYSSSLDPEEKFMEDYENMTESDLVDLPDDDSYFNTSLDVIDIVKL